MLRNHQLNSPCHRAVGRIEEGRADRFTRGRLAELLTSPAASSPGGCVCFRPPARRAWVSLSHLRKSNLWHRMQYLICSKTPCVRSGGFCLVGNYVHVFTTAPFLVTSVPKLVLFVAARRDRVAAGARSSFVRFPMARARVSPARWSTCVLSSTNGGSTTVELSGRSDSSDPTFARALCIRDTAPFCSQPPPRDASATVPKRRHPHSARARAPSAWLDFELTRFREMSMAHRQGASTAHPRARCRVPRCARYSLHPLCS
jgi:hypothetical protein